MNLVLKSELTVKPAEKSALSVVPKHEEPLTCDELKERSKQAKLNRYKKRSY